MKVLRLHAPGDLRIHDEPLPNCGSGEILVRVKAVGICSSDIHWFSEGSIGLAVEEIIKTIEAGWDGIELGEPKTIVLPPTLIVRQSSLRHKG